MEIFFFAKKRIFYNLLLTYHFVIWIQLSPISGISSSDSGAKYRRRSSDRICSSTSSSSRYSQEDMRSSRAYHDSERQKQSGHLPESFLWAPSVSHSLLISSPLISQGMRYIVQKKENSKWESDRYSPVSSSLMRSIALPRRYNPHSWKLWRKSA